VVLAACLVLGEPISPARGVGSAFVAIGILLVGLTAHA
jgi:drug/metabolite transporter (DMT)-like permease